MQNRILTILLCIFSFGASTIFAEPIKRVFILASYEKEHVCGYPQEIGIVSGLSKEGWFKGLNLEIGQYYMDTKRTNNTPDLMKQEARAAIKKIDAFKPDVLLTIDDNAFREVGLAYVGRTDIAVVFSGLNGQPEAYNKKIPIMENRLFPGKNVTGVYEKLYVKRSLEVMQRAVTEVNGTKFIGITDYSPTGNAITRQFAIELKSLPAGVVWELKRVRDWQGYTQLIRQINKDNRVKAIYPVALTLKTDKNEVYTALEIFKWTTENSNKPEMALNYFFSKIGLFGGAAVDFKSMGFLAGKKAGKILNGTKPGTLPIEDAPDYAIVFNLKRARALGIEIPFPLLTAADNLYK